MRARDVMTEGVICLDQWASIFDAAELLISAGVSALPVVDGKGTMIGIVTEADLMRRGEIGTTARGSWMSRLLGDREVSAHEYVRSHSRRITEVMTKKVVTAREDASLRELVNLMEKHGIKRIPIVRDGSVAGIVSRADILRVLLSCEPGEPAGRLSDEELRRAVVAALEKHGWTSSWPTNVFANAGVVHLWGFVPGEEVRQAYRVAAENVPGVRRVKSHLRPMPASVAMGT
jgi:CBS domain-containing protein